MIKISKVKVLRPSTEVGVGNTTTLRVWYDSKDGDFIRLASDYSDKVIWFEFDTMKRPNKELSYLLNIIYLGYKAKRVVA